MFVQRVARAIGHAVQRQHDGQIFFRHRHRAVFVAMDDGNRRAPVALAANAPVAQAPGGFFLAQAFGSQVCGHRIDAGLEAQAVEFAGVDANRTALLSPYQSVQTSRELGSRCEA